MKAILAALLLTAATPVAASAQTTTTIQQDFDAATAALDARNWLEAVRLYDALEARVRGPRSRAIARVRKAAALAELMRVDEAEALLRDALPLLPADDRTLDSDRFAGFVALGLIAEARLDYDDAARHYGRAAALPIADAQKLTAYRGLIQTQLFSDAGAALATADAALRTVASMPEPRGTVEAQFHTMKGRALLNLARYAEAQAELELAMRQLGHLTLRVDMNDLVARSDLSIAALLAGAEDRARRYLAFTGAGRLARGAVTPRSPNVPPCGNGITPDDVAVVQLGIADDGRVTYAMPIYASRPGPAALEFARFARRWSFEPQTAAEVAGLLRAVVRIEMRCSDVADPSGKVEDEWALLPGVATADPAWGRSIAANINRPTDALRAELADLERAGSPSGHGTLPLLLILANRGSLSTDERVGFRRRALAVAAARDAPPAIVAAIAIALGRSSPPRMGTGSPARPPSPDFDAILAFPEVGASPRAQAMIRLARARDQYYLGHNEEAVATVAGVVRSLPDLAPADPLMQQGREILVAAETDRGDANAARRARDAMGANAPRCGLQPRWRRNSAGSGDFPMEALSWGFEGWAINELAMTPQGEVAVARTVIAYPPFVFGEAARRVARRTRNVATYVPDGGPCTYGRQSVIFLLPR